MLASLNHRAENVGISAIVVVKSPFNSANRRTGRRRHRKRGAAEQHIAAVEGGVLQARPVSVVAVGL